MDKGYLAVARSLRKSSIPVVSGFDDIWFKTFRQGIASLLFPIFKKVYYSHAWVAGPYQYEFAKRLGFKNSEIIHNCLSCDIELFNKSYTKSIEYKRSIYPHRFLFVGRFEISKGIKILMQAWGKIKEQRKDWELYLIGNGSLYEYITSFSDIVVLDFMQPEILAQEIENAGCYVLPSIFEPWALVLHEFSAAGLPIICSNICGAVPLFVTPGFNGFTFKSEDINDLENKILKIINLSDKELIQMGENSHKLGQKITPEIAAASFLSVLN